MHALVYLVADITINLLEMQERKWQTIFQWDERLTETGAQFRMIELGRAGNMTRQTSGRKSCSKNERAHLEEAKNISHGRKT